jgi:hypothetical protein
MEKVRFCRHCGELLEIQWIHCPWCGIEVIQTRDEWDAMVDVSLEKTEKSSRSKVWANWTIYPVVSMTWNPNWMHFWRDDADTPDHLYELF